MKKIKERFLKLDELLFNNAYKSLREKYLIKKAIKKRKFFFDHNLDVGFFPSSKGELNKLCDKYGSDKGESHPYGHPYSWPSHTYTEVYEMIFYLNRGGIKKVLECGIGTSNKKFSANMGVKGKPGASLRVWRDYFPNASVIGIDIDKEILFQEKRISTYYCDQTSSKSIKQFLKKARIGENSLDIIIDDGLHEFKAGISLFQNLFCLLSRKGFYFIEDIKLSDYFKYIEYFSNKKDDFKIRFIDLHRPNLNLSDNRMIIINKF